MCLFLAIFVAGVGAAESVPFVPNIVIGFPTVPVISINVEIPAPPDSMRLYNLTATPAPIEFLNEKLDMLTLPTLSIDMLNLVASSSLGNEARLRAFIDLSNGDTEFVPSLAEAVKTPRPMTFFNTDVLTRVPLAAFMDERFIPKDDTELRVAEPITIFGAANKLPGAAGQSGETRTEPMPVMTMVPAMRYAGGFKVYGPGSHAVVTVSNDGLIIGAARRWGTASVGEPIRPSITAEEVRSEILRQLEPMVATSGTHADVDLIEIAYYDNNQTLLQPVYHFEATVQPPDAQFSPYHVSGFVPLVSSPREPIPSLVSPPKFDLLTLNLLAFGEETPHTADQVASGITLAGTMQSGITLGEYVNREWKTDHGYYTMANAFLAGLNSRSWTPRTTRTQYIEAWPSQVVGPLSKKYMNAVNVAFTVPHGAPYISTTLSNCCDEWDIRQIGTGGNPGFGAAAGGVLATWVIASCSVVPAFIDAARDGGNGFDAFTPWWPVFQGLHNVLSFRTTMWYPEDGFYKAFGNAASGGGDVVAAWFQKIAAYYSDGGSLGCAFVDARNLGQSIYDVGAQNASSTLWNFWMGN
jgi:hypothetical protein